MTARKTAKKKAARKQNKNYVVVSKNSAVSLSPPLNY
jgi:hypothetical protein